MLPNLGISMHAYTRFSKGDELFQLNDQLVLEFSNLRSNTLWKFMLLEVLSMVCKECIIMCE